MQGDATEGTKGYFLYHRLLLEKEKKKRKKEKTHQNLENATTCMHQH